MFIETYISAVMLAILLPVAFVMYLDRIHQAARREQRKAYREAMRRHGL